VWGREVEGRVLRFRLAGINNQNFLMRDEETGSYWQQITGQAIAGPLKGKQLPLVHWDELSFGVWRDENPRGKMLRPVGEYAGRYATKDWDKKMGKRASVVDTAATKVAPRELVVGVKIDGASRAYRYEKLVGDKLVMDRVGGQPIVIVVGLDGRSVRAFEAKLPGTGDAAEFYRKEELGGGMMMDSVSGAEWNFAGCALGGEYQGKCLAPVRLVKDYWFDWWSYNKESSIR
jgi:hypothetical protein